MNVDTRGYVRQLDGVDVVRRIPLRRLDSWLLDETNEAFAIAIDGLIDPVGNGDSWSGVGVVGIDVPAFKRETECIDTCRAGQDSSSDTCGNR